MPRASALQSSEGHKGSCLHGQGSGSTRPTSFHPAEDGIHVQNQSDFPGCLYSKSSELVSTGLLPGTVLSSGPKGRLLHSLGEAQVKIYAKAPKSAEF